MMDPTRWSQGDGLQGELTELERQLLEAARQDRIPSAVGARMAEGLGVHFAGVVSQVAAQSGGGLAAGGKLGAPLFAKTGLWGVLSVALAAAVATWYAARPAPAPHASASRTVAAPVASTQPEAPVAVVAAPAVVAPAELPRVPEVADELPAPAHVAVTPALRARSAAVDNRAGASRRRFDNRAGASRRRFDDVALRAETALLDRARTALHGGASADALRVLDQHRRRFAHGRLAPEAAALRIEALVQRGSYDEAAAMSQRFVSAYPRHPLSERVVKLAAARAPSGSR